MEVGISFVDFCCRNWIPVYLVRDNIGENIGGSLLEECRKRNVKSVFICPRHPQQNYAEGYLGRVTAMASFAMVFAGAPLFMWIFAIRTAVFICNISASYYSVQQLWSTPYKVTHNEPFPDASIVVPFGCAVLVLRDSDDRSKFQNRCTLMIFVHYSDDHPLFTYAVYSPRTKRVIHRQYVIFLTSVFPMRLARTASGLAQGGDSLTVVRSPPSMLDGCPAEFSFGLWSHGDALPDHDDDVTGFNYEAVPEDYVEVPEELQGLPAYSPSHVSFPESSILVPIRAVPLASVISSPTGTTDDGPAGDLDNPRDEPLVPMVFPDRMAEASNVPIAGCDAADGECAVPDDLVSEGEIVSTIVSEGEIFSTIADPVPVSSRRQVGQRWYYDPVSPAPVAAPVLSKRISKPPPRLTSSQLGTVSSILDPSRLGLVIRVPGSTDGADSSSSNGERVSGSSEASVPLLGTRSLSARPYPVLRGSSGGIPPSSSRVASIAGAPTDRFSVRLLFPERNFPPIIYPVKDTMLVSRLRLLISQLVEAVSLVHLLVGPSWTLDILDHSGTITDRVFPGTTISCLYLQQGSRVLVYLDRPDTEPFIPSVPVPLGLSSLDFAQAVGGWRSATIAIDDAVSPMARPRLDRLPLFSSPVSDSDVTNSSIVPAAFFGAAPLADFSDSLVPIRRRRRNGENDASMETLDSGLVIRTRRGFSSGLPNEELLHSYSSSSAVALQRGYQHDSSPDGPDPRDGKRPRLEGSPENDPCLEEQLERVPSNSPTPPIYSPPRPRAILRSLVESGRLFSKFSARNKSYIESATVPVCDQNGTPRLQMIKRTGKKERNWSQLHLLIRKWRWRLLRITCSTAWQLTMKIQRPN
jgi:hypothetical protein